MDDYPMAYEQYRGEISLPIYPQLTRKELDYIVDVITKAVESTL